MLLLSLLGVGEKIGNCGFDIRLRSDHIVIVGSDSLVVICLTDRVLQSLDRILDGITLEVVLHVGTLSGDSSQSIVEFLFQNGYDSVGVCVGFLTCLLGGNLLIMFGLSCCCVSYEKCDSGLDVGFRSDQVVIVGGDRLVLVCLFDCGLQLFDCGADILALELILHVGTVGGDCFDSVGILLLEVCYDSVGVCVGLLTCLFGCDCLFVCFLSGFSFANELGYTVLDFRNGSHNRGVVVGQSHVGISLFDICLQSVDLLCEFRSGKLVFHIGTRCGYLREGVGERSLQLADLGHRVVVGGQTVGHRDRDSVVDLLCAEIYRGLDIVEYDRSGFILEI